MIAYGCIWLHVIMCGSGTSGRAGVPARHTTRTLQLPRFLPTHPPFVHFQRGFGKVMKQRVAIDNNNIESCLGAYVFVLFCLVYVHGWGAHAFCLGLWPRGRVILVPDHDYNSDPNLRVVMQGSTTSFAWRI